MKSRKKIRKSKSTVMSREVYSDVKKASEYLKGVSAAQENATILFADLVGSLAFKDKYGDTLGQLRTFEHNIIGGESIEESGGSVVKFIGDEVMGCFRGNGGLTKALSSAKLILSRLKDRNLKIARPQLKIESRVGVAAGPVNFWKVPGLTQPDPQGQTVDIAARLCSGAQVNQILVSNLAKANIRGTERSFLSRASTAHIKGVSEPVPISEFRWDRQKRAIQIADTFPNPNQERRKQLADIRKEIAKRNYNKAIEICKIILRSCPDDPHANLYAARVYCLLEKPQKAVPFYQQIHRQYPNAVKIISMGAFMDWLNGRYSRAINGAQKALHIARRKDDIVLIIRQCNNLAYFFCSRGRKTDIKEAMSLIDEALDLWESEELRMLVPRCLDTKAKILLEVGTKEKVEEARMILERLRDDGSIEEYWLDEHLAECKRAQMSLEE